MTVPVENAILLPLEQFADVIKVVELASQFGLLYTARSFRAECICSKSNTNEAPQRWTGRAPRFSSMRRAPRVFAGCDVES